MWVDTQTGKIVASHSDIRAARPNWMAPNVLTPEMIQFAGFEVYKDPVPPTPESLVPQVVTMRQARLALLEIGKLDYVEEAINSLPVAQRDAANIEWNYSSIVERRSGITIMIASSLGLDEEALDELFILADTL